MMMRKVLLFAMALFVLNSSFLIAQIENVSIAHPIYKFLERFETKGILHHKSLASLPLQRIEIMQALELISEQNSELSSAEKKLLEKYLIEFGLSNEAKHSVVFYSPSDSEQVFSSQMFSDNEKYIYRYVYDDTRVELSPLASFDYMRDFGKNDDATIGTLGVRLSGTLTGNFGYYLQATNGRLLSGNRDIALMDDNYRHSIKFSKLKDDIDLTESHINFQSKWFFASIGRETRLEGAGLDQRVFISNTSPPFDALILATKFSNFEYKFMHSSLLALPTLNDVGFHTVIPQKYMAMHKFSLRPSWGEISFIEQVVYSDRNTDLAYLNPIGFLKSIEHALRDRDNSLMGLYATVRPYKNWQLKGSYLLDDLIFEKIGTGYWSNKMAYNISVQYATDWNVELAFEYARVEPFTFSHFNVQNSITNDGLLIGSNIMPNSDRLMLVGRWWFGGRYPLEIGLSHTRHGKNIFDGDSLIVNAGGDPLQTRRYGDPMEVDFLSGDVSRIFSIDLSYGYEFIRGFSIHAYLRHSNNNSFGNQFARIILRFNDF